MEEEKAAAYYDELTRKGEGAARFKQGLGFSTTTNSDDVVPKPGSALVSSSSFLSNFVRASSPSKNSEFEKQAQLQSIQNKLKKKPNSSSEPQHEPSRVSDRTHKSRDTDRDSSRRRSRSRSRSRERRRDRDSRGSGRRSRSRDKYRDSRRRSRSRERNRDRDDERRRRKRSISPRERRSDKRNGSDVVGDSRRVNKVSKEKNAVVDYARLIPGYDKMSPADRVKAKMKLQLSETSEKDSEKGVGWERFEFNKDAPLDDEEVEVAEDDASLVKHIGQSFRFSAVEARREEQIQAAHDEAMFGTSAAPPPVVSDSEPEKEDNEKDDKRKGLVSSLLSESVLAKRKGSWRDRVQLQDS